MSYYDCEEIADLEKEILQLKQKLNEANKKIKKLEHERKNLLRKLKGVRAARLRDNTKANARLHNCVESYNHIVQSLVDRKAEARADRLDSVIWHLSDALVSSGKLSQSEWEDFYLSALDAYKKMHKKENQND